eukprot:TRINITY_DN4931_c2_g1_i2.p1 TRINITY_DN4931_c2_g1~~TRINITY_DN4931_c2_g1_i2.p1  ORF type:complete len:263 (+),score=56.33 TRINITY_DN4931_c2_g1_i2:365-1153(+)
MMHAASGRGGFLIPFIEYLLLGGILDLPTVDLTHQIPESLLQRFTKRHTKPDTGLSSSVVRNMLRVVDAVLLFNDKLKGDLIKEGDDCLTKSLKLDEGAEDADESSEEDQDSDCASAMDEVEKLRRTTRGRRILEEVEYADALAGIFQQEDLVLAMTCDFEGDERETSRGQAVADCIGVYNALAPDLERRALSTRQRHVTRALSNVLCKIEAWRLRTRMHADMQSVVREIRQGEATASSFMSAQWLAAIDETAAGLSYADGK